jgi:hypothetical protein
VILGRRIGNAAAEKGIDIAVKTFIRKAWLKRNATRIHLNTLLGRNDDLVLFAPPFVGVEQLGVRICALSARLAASLKFIY